LLLTHVGGRNSYKSRLLTLSHNGQKKYFWRFCAVLANFRGCEKLALDNREPKRYICIVVETQPQTKKNRQKHQETTMKKPTKKSPKGFACVYADMKDIYLGNTDGYRKPMNPVVRVTRDEWSLTSALYPREDDVLFEFSLDAFDDYFYNTYEDDNFEANDAEGDEFLRVVG